MEKKIEAIVTAIEQGILTETTRDRLLELEGQKKMLMETLAKPAPSPFPSLHPNLAGLYKRKVAALEQALNDPEIRSSAGEILRSLIDRIEITWTSDATGHPDAGFNAPNAVGATQETEVSVILYGELAAVISLAEENGIIDNKGGFSLSAGARNHLFRTRMKWRKPS